MVRPVRWQYGGRDQVPDDSLSPCMVPRAADWPPRTYDGDAYWDDVAALANRWFVRFEKTGELPARWTIARLYFEERRAHHTYGDGMASPIVLALLGRIKQVLTARE